MEFIIDENIFYFGILLTGDNTGFSIEQRALNEGFRKQNKRHVTILGGSTKDLLKDILDKMLEEEKKETFEKIKIILKSLEWKFVPTKIYKIKKQGYFSGLNILENRESYINTIDMPDMGIFYEKLNLLLKSKLPMQVPHITLFTKGERENPDYYGISISSMEEFETLNPIEVY